MELGAGNIRPGKTQGPGGSTGHSGRNKPNKFTNAGIIAQPTATQPTGGGTPTKSKNSSYTHVRHQSSGKHSDGSSRPCPEHSFLTDVADVRQMEQGLLQLLDNFHSGKLQAFGQDCPFEKMDQVREQQERLARLHFELDCQQEMTGIDTTEGREEANRNLNKLTSNLQELCSSIQDLQKTEPSSSHPHV